MNNDLIQRLLLAENDFLVALENGPRTLASYNQTWSALPDAVYTATKTGSISNEILFLAHSVADRIASIASCFLDIRRGEESFMSSLQSDCDTMLQQMAALDLNADPKSLQPDDRHDIPHSSRSQPCTPNANGEDSLSFPASAQQWLVDNLHNPYPSTEVKAQMAATSSCQVSSINSWFINARRRIGWTTLCREHFSGCRADMLDAAYRALVEEDSERLLPPEIRHSFVTMKAKAECLYSSTLTRSAFVGDLDAVIKDMTKKSDVEKCDQIGKENFTKGPYPSPDPSATASPVPALDDSLIDESEEGDVAPPIIAGAKRRRPSVEPGDQHSKPSSRPTKRLRPSIISRTCLLSPPSSTDGADELSYHSSPEPCSAHSPKLNKIASPRKRLLSDANVTRTPESSSNSQASSHPYSVMEPIPCSNTINDYSIDDWFNANFDDLFSIPPPVDAIEPDLSASLEVELFKNYNIPGDPKYISKCLPTSTAGVHASAPFDLSNPDSMLQSIDGHTSVVASNSMLPSGITEAPYFIPPGSSSPDVSQTDVDWTSLLSTAGAYHPAVCPSFYPYPTDPSLLPEIDLSMLQLPQVTSAAHPQGESASRQAKLERLHAMQEEVWRMEQELRLEGVVLPM